MNPVAASRSAVDQLDLTTIRSLLKEVVDPATDARWGVYQAAGSGSIISTLARHVEQTVFSEEDYGLTPSEMDDEFGPYDERSVWTLVVHHDSLLPVAAVRSLVGPAEHQKAADDLLTYWGMSWAEAARAGGFRPGAQFVEACTYSVLREWRTADNGWLAKVLIAIQQHIAIDLGAVASTQIINPRARRAFKRWGVPFDSVAPVALIKGAPFEPAFSRIMIGAPWLNSSDDEFVRLVRRRATDGRSGTRLEPIELDRDPVAVAHNKWLFELDGVALDEPCLNFS